MKKWNLILAAVLVITVQNYAVSSESKIFKKGDYSAITTLKPTPKQPYAKISPAEYQNLKTTEVPGIYCQQTDDFGGNTKQRHFFYNKEKEEMVEIPYLYYIDPFTMDQMGSYRKEYEWYGVKSNTFIQNGIEYKIPTIR